MTTDTEFMSTSTASPSPVRIPTMCKRFSIVGGLTRSSMTTKPAAVGAAP